MWFEKYDEITTALSKYLPWLYLCRDNIVRNKDGSLICAFIYNEIDISILKQIALSGICIWIDYNFGVKTLYIVYNPCLTDADFGKIRSSIEKFGEFIEALERTYKITSLKNEELIESLYKTVTVNEKIKMLENPIYLDYKLTKQHQYKKYQKQYLMIDDTYLQCIKLLGYPDFITKPLIAFLQTNEIKFRMSRRYIFVSGGERKKEIQRYTSSWSSSHKEFLKVLRYDDSEICGYYDTLLTVYEKNIDELPKKVTSTVKFLANCGVPTVIDKSNMGDIWYSTLPGMLRSNIMAPLMEITINKDMFFM
ncbi:MULTISPECIES: VirB4 family type IV secretion/conjugal transfer ATPase [Megamonas]|jgi:hypothetical protein|uniref:VirB4 family type IV secretion/conjugal transfer ATPase n=1 Tax=Megamonas TaxID=158846 RepID=UPI000E3FAB0E|nr:MULTISPECIES: hypothetical protein [Megamonas]RGO06055.1 hypothetical protein DXB32_01410 [Megamonas rupellensis]